MARKIIKGDIVKVIAGDDKGKTGKVSKVILEKDRTLVIVEGVNLAIVHRKPTNDKPGSREKVAKPIDISNVMLMDGGQVSRVGFTISQEEKDGQSVSKKSRVFKKTNKKVNE